MKPDIIDLAFGRLPKMTPENMSLTQGRPDEICGEDRKSDRITWPDVTHCWKLEVYKTLEKGGLARLDEGYKVEDASSVFGESKSPDNVFLFLKVLEGGRGPVNDPELSECSPVSRSEALQQRWKDLKRRYEDTSEEASNSSLECHNTKKRKTEEERLESDLPSEMHCGLYGLQLLRSAWDRTHSIVILLRGAQFNDVASRKTHSDRLQTTDFLCNGMTARAALQLHTLTWLPNCRFSSSWSYCFNGLELECEVGPGGPWKQSSLASRSITVSLNMLFLAEDRVGGG
jgi:hypothetical protein